MTEQHPTKGDTMTTPDPFPWDDRDPVDPTDPPLPSIARDTVPTGPFVECPPSGLDALIGDDLNRRIVEGVERRTIANALDQLSGDVGSLSAFTRVVRDRLRAQYGRREVGEPTVKIERTPLYADGDDTSGGTA